MAERQSGSEFPFESKYVAIHGSRIHYIDEGEGEPVLFLHGNPTSSYIWRNIIPHLTPQARCIAPDLVGMGRSDKPDIRYRFVDHYRYIDAFIRMLDLRDITLVVHDWGSGLGLHYASQNESNVRAIAFMEAIVKPFNWHDLPEAFRMGFRLFRAPVVGWFTLSVMNIFVKQILPRGVVRPLTEEEMAAYAAPYPTVASRKPVRMWPREIPINGRPADMHRIVSAYSRWLTETKVPKLMFFAHPGGVILEERARWCRENIPHLEAVDIGEGIHFVQEDHPQEIGSVLADWYAALPPGG